MIRLAFSPETAGLPRCLLFFLLLASTLLGATPAEHLDLTDLSLEELVNVEVVTPSRTEQRLMDASAAVYVLSGDELRRAGVQTLPDALRLVPGLFVAQVDANKWVVTSRGFAGLFANKLLVLIDGRSVYTPLFSGVFWEAQDVVFDDVDRIEVIRGPGGALWGANAVNGIINIITKSAYATSGTFLQAIGGSALHASGTARFGAGFGSRGAFRLFGKHFARGASVGGTPAGSRDNWDLTEAGGRIDWGASAFVSGQIYTGNVGQTIRIADPLQSPVDAVKHTRSSVRGGHMLGHWAHARNGWGQFQVQAYYDRAERKESFLEGAIETIDVDLQHHFESGRRWDMVWGAGYRRVSDHFDGSPTTSFQPDRQTTHLFSGFVQQNLHLTARLRLTAGTKLEHNSYTGFEWQPNARLWWAPTEHQVVWAAVGRAVRTPSRADRTIRGTYLLFPADSLYVGAPPALAQFSGNADFQSETVRALDVGYRQALGNRLFLDMAAFYNTYRHLRSTEPDLSNLQFVRDPGYFLVPVLADNLARGSTRGLELAADWQVRPGWRVRAAYSYFDMALQVDATSRDVVTPSFAHETPAHQFNVRSYLDLPGGVEADFTGRFVDGLPTQQIGRYATCDVHLSWRVHRALVLSLVGRNLLQHTHQEFISSAASTLPTAVARSAFGSLDWTF